MAYDLALAERIRAELARHVEFTEKKMFGGLSFLVNGHMCCGITGTDLVLRLSPEKVEQALFQTSHETHGFHGQADEVHGLRKRGGNVVWRLTSALGVYCGRHCFRDGAKEEQAGAQTG